jgi:hypothetical protein
MGLQVTWPANRKLTWIEKHVIDGGNAVRKIAEIKTQMGGEAILDRDLIPNDRWLALYGLTAKDCTPANLAAAHESNRLRHWHLVPEWNPPASTSPICDKWEAELQRWIKQQLTRHQQRREQAIKDEEDRKREKRRRILEADDEPQQPKIPRDVYGCRMDTVSYDINRVMLKATKPHSIEWIAKKSGASIQRVTGHMKWMMASHRRYAKEKNGRFIITGRTAEDRGK